MDSLQTLIYLCHVKNELNRKRRRFYNLLRDMHGPVVRGYKTVPFKHKLFTSAQCNKEYKKACDDMKSMTPKIKALCKSVGAHLIWNDGWLIVAVKTNDKKRIKQSDFKSYYNDEMFDKIILQKG